MKRRLLFANVFCFLALLALPFGAFAQDGDDSKLSMGASVNIDAFFGAYPTVGGGYPINDKVDFTFYGIMWGYGNPGATWANWTEFGAGVNFAAGDFDINPQLGFTMGSLLSSGAAQQGVVGDGIVPNLTVNYGSEVLEGQLYAGYYAALRDEAAEGGTTNNYVHYWINAGAKVAPFFSIGGQFEELFLSGGSNVDDSVDGYQWLGPYVKFSSGNASLMFAAGGDLTDDADSFSSSEFYKMSLSFDF